MFRKYFSIAFDLSFKLFILLLAIFIIYIASGFNHITTPEYINSLPDTNLFIPLRNFLEEISKYSMGEAGQPYQYLYGFIYASILLITIVLMPGRRALEILAFLLAGAIPKQRENWGIVMNSVTGKPISFATITVEDANTGSYIARSVADLDGRYRINIRGKLADIKIIVRAQGYQIYEKVLRNDTFNNLNYINSNITLKPTNVTKGTVNISKIRMQFKNFYPKLIYIIYIMTLIIFILSIHELNFLKVPVQFTLTKLIMFTSAIVWNTLIIYERIIEKPGKILSNIDSNPIEGALLSIFDSEGKQLGNYMSDGEGIVITDLKPGTYIAKLNKTGYLIYNDEEKLIIKVNLKGYLSNNIILNKDIDSNIQNIASPGLMNPFA